MKCLNRKRLAVVLVVALACASASAQAAELANPTGFSYYGYANGSFGYGGVDAAPATAGYGAPSFASYPGYAGYPYGGYGYPGYNAYGYGNYGYGASGGCGAAGCGRRGHHCSFGGNFGCCMGVWDGYCSGDCGYGAGCCAAPVKVHRRHRALGCGAGPCVDAACGAATCGAGACGPACHGRVHRCHLRRYQAYGCSTTGGCYGYAGAGGMMMDPSQPQTHQPASTGTEQLQAPMPTFETDEPPAPSPSDNSST